MLLGGVLRNALLHAGPHNLHQLDQRPAEPRYLRNYQAITFLHLPNNAPELPFLKRHLPAHSLHHPLVHSGVLLLKVTPDFIFLVLGILLPGTDPQISNYHIWLQLVCVGVFAFSPPRPGPSCSSRPGPQRKHQTPTISIPTASDPRRNNPET